MPFLTRKTPEERKEIVLGLIRGRYYLLDSEEKIRLCALPLMLGALKDVPTEDLAQIGMIVGDMTKAGPWMINGMPMFSEVMLIHKEDWKLIAEAYNREIKRFQKIEV